MKTYLMDTHNPGHTRTHSHTVYKFQTNRWPFIMYDGPHELSTDINSNLVSLLTPLILH